MSSERNPHRIGAFSLEDVKPGKAFVEFNVECGVVRRGTFLEVTDNASRVRIQRDTGGEETASLADMGVIPYPSGEWSNVNFLVSPENEAALPRPFPLPRERMEFKNDRPRDEIEEIGSERWRAALGIKPVRRVR